MKTKSHTPDKDKQEQATLLWEACMAACNLNPETEEWEVPITHKREQAKQGETPPIINHVDSK